MKKDWIRRLRDTGDKIPITKQEAHVRLQGYYHDVPLAMSGATKDAPATTGYSDYYPVK